MPLAKPHLKSIHAWHPSIVRLDDGTYYPADIVILALGRFGPALHFAAVLAEAGQLGLIAAGLARAQPAAEQAVHRQVGIATDGGSKVGVMRESEPVVPDVLRGVNCFRSIAHLG